MHKRNKNIYITSFAADWSLTPCNSSLNSDKFANGFKSRYRKSVR